MNKKLSFWKHKYEVAKSAFADEKARMIKSGQQYEGKLQPNTGRETTCIYNFTKELIETEIDTTIPAPKVEPVVYSEKNAKLANIIEEMLRGEVKKLHLEQFNDLDERNAKVMGSDVVLVDWDNTIRTHGTVGGIELKNISPLRFVPQPKIENVDGMDYLFCDFDITKKNIKVRYGVDVQTEGLDDEGDITGDLCTLHICTYKSKEGYIGCFGWVRDTIVIDEEYYNARNLKVCAECGLTKPAGVDTCICGSKKWVKKNLKFEELDRDIVNIFGTIIPEISVKTDDEGNFVYEDVEVQATTLNPSTGVYEPLYEQVFDDNMNVIGEQPMMTTEKTVVYEKTKIPYYTPTNYPILVRKNISRTGTVIGDSDCEFIRDLQLSADQIGTRMLEKSKKQGSVLYKPENLDYNPDNSEQVINISSPDQVAMLGTRDMNFDVTQNIALIGQYYTWAKSALGINDSAQGKKDTTALSGTAKQMQISRMIGRQETKTKMKNVFYCEIYRKIFEYMLAYADEPREYTAEDIQGNSENVVFNRYDFLEQDEFGNWYYNDQFIFTIDESGFANENRQYVLEMMQKDFIGGLYGDATNPETMYNFWKDRADQGYPNAKRQVKRWKEKMTQQAQMMQMMPTSNNQIVNNPGTDQASPQDQAENSVKGGIFGDIKA